MAPCIIIVGSAPEASVPSVRAHVKDAWIVIVTPDPPAVAVDQWLTTLDGYEKVLPSTIDAVFQLVSPATLTQNIELWAYSHPGQRHPGVPFWRLDMPVRTPLVTGVDGLDAWDWEVRLASDPDLLLRGLRLPHDLTKSCDGSPWASNRRRIMTISHCYGYGTWSYYRFLTRSLPHDILNLYYSQRQQIEAADMSRVGLIHLNSLFHLDMDGEWIASFLTRHAHIPAVLTIHDFQWIFGCAQPNPMEAVLRRLQPSEAECATLLKILRCVKTIYMPSEFLRDQYLLKTSALVDLNDELNRKTVVADNPDLPVIFDNLVCPPVDDVYRVAYVGTYMLHKGSLRFAQLSLNMREHAGKPVEFHVFGDGDDFSHPSRLVHHGRYNDDTIVDLLHEHRIHAIVFPGKWGETWGFALSRAIHSGIPLCYRDIGAMRERLTVKSKRDRFFRFTDDRFLEDALRCALDYATGLQGTSRFTDPPREPVLPLQYSEMVDSLPTASFYNGL